VTEVSLQGNAVRFSPVELADSAQMRLRRLYPRSNYKTTVSTLSVPRPTADGSTFGATAVRDIALLKWCGDVLDAIAG
jgi:transcription-repair coupling factor (superfamily II helicase)